MQPGDHNLTNRDGVPLRDLEDQIDIGRCGDHPRVTRAEAWPLLK